MNLFEHDDCFKDALMFVIICSKHSIKLSACSCVYVYMCALLPFTE